MSLTTLRIEGKGGTASGYRLYLDNMDISSFTRAVSLDMDVDDVNTAILEVYIGQVELSADVEAKLVHVDPHQGDEHDRTSFVSKIREWVRR